MGPRDPHEAHRVASPLELFFDLVFVVAIASAAAELHHGLTAGHLETVVGYTMVFFAIWWAWMNFTWFASAYDSDDVLYRLLTFTIMTGSLMLAAGVPDLFDDGQSGVVVAGYAVMRLGMVALWLRAARSHPEGRRTALTYAVGITVVQALWIARLLLDGQGVLMSTFFLLVLAELAVPVVAERFGGPTPFHPHHIAERFGLFTIIVLGEVILASVQALQGALAAPTDAASAGHAAEPSGLAAAGGGGGMNGSLAMLVAGGLLLVFSLWWLYFKREHVDLIGQGRLVTWAFSYAHIVVFASVAAVGAALAASVDVIQGVAEASPRTVALALATALSLYALTLSGVHAIADRKPSLLAAAATLAAVAVVAALLDVDMGLRVLLMGLAAAGSVAQHVWVTHRPGAPTVVEPAR
jgi:low temperature requirement protein LtrA